MMLGQILPPAQNTREIIMMNLDFQLPGIPTNITECQLQRLSVLTFKHNGKTVILKHTLSTAVSNQKYSGENYKIVTRRKCLHFSPDQLDVEREFTHEKFIYWLISMCGNQDWIFRFPASYLESHKKLSFWTSLDHQMCISLCSALNGNSNLIEPKSPQPNECLQPIANHENLFDNL